MDFCPGYKFVDLVISGSLMALMAKRSRQHLAWIDKNRAEKAARFFVCNAPEGCRTERFSDRIETIEILYRFLVKIVLESSDF